MLGGEIANRLLERGEAVRVLVRHHNPTNDHFHQGNKDKITALIEAGAKPVYGDLKDGTSLKTACEGIDQVITTANSAGRGGEDTPKSVDLQGNRNLIDAAREAGVEQFIFISGEIGEPFRQLPFALAKLETETYLKASGLIYSILAPNTFMEGTVIRIIGEQVVSEGLVKLIGSGEKVHSFIARSDVASFAIKALDHPQVINNRLILGGPEPISLQDVVGVYERVLDREIPVQTYPPGKQVPGLDETATFMLTSYDTFDLPVDMSDLCRIFEIKLRPLEVVIREELERGYS